jgi:hypothetical protein
MEAVAIPNQATPPLNNPLNIISTVYDSVFVIQENNNIPIPGANGRRPRTRLGQLSALSYILPGHKADSVFIAPCGLVVDQLNPYRALPEAAVVTSPEDLEPLGPAETLARNIEGWN